MGPIYERDETSSKTSIDNFEKIPFKSWCMKFGLVDNIMTPDLLVY